MSDSLFASLADEFGALLYPLERAMTVPGALEGMLAELGALPDTDAAPLAAALESIVAEKRAIDTLAEEATPSFDSIANVLTGAGRAFAAIEAFGSGDGQLGQLGDFGRDIGELLLSAWLTVLHPVVHQVLVLLTILEPLEDQPLSEVQLDAAQKPVRLGYRIDRLHPSRLVDLLRDPETVMRAEYGTPLATVADADAMADKLFPRVVGLLRELGVPCRYGINPADAVLLADSASPLAHSLAVYLDHPLNVGASAEAGAVFSFSSADRGDLGLVVTPFGALATSRGVGPFTITVDFNAGVAGVAYGRNGLTLLADTAATGFNGKVTAEQVVGADAAPFVIGSPTGTRLELLGTKFGVETALSQTRQSLALSADVPKGSLVVAPADGDSFLASILPADGLRADFSTGLTWSNEHGLTFRGSAGLDATLPVGLSAAGVSLPDLHVGLHATDGKVDAVLSAGLEASIGPVDVSVDGVGVRATLTFPEDGGNLGVADLDLGFKAPDAARALDRRRTGGRRRLPRL